MSSAVINNGLLFGFSHYDRGRLFCLDPSNGDVLWTGPPRTGNNVTFLSIPDYVVALLDKGEIRILRANKNQYEVAKSYSVSDDTWAPPVLLNDGFLIKDKSTLVFWRFDN